MTTEADLLLTPRHRGPDGTLSAALHLAVELAWSESKDGEHSAQRAAECVLRLGPSTQLPVETPAVMALRLGLKRDGLAPSTVNRYLAALSVVLRHGEEAGWGAAPRIRREREPEGRCRVLTPEEEADLRGRLRADWGEFSVFLVETGCRVGEAVGLRWEEVGEGSVHLRRTKGAKARRIPLTKRALAALASRPRTGAGPWSEVSTSAWNKAFARARDGAGLDREVVPHALRHTCASRLLAKGVALATVKEWLGHASITTTMRYAHLEAGALDAAARLLED